MKVSRLVMVLAMVVAVAVGMAIAQAPPAGGQGGPGGGGPPGGGGGGRGRGGPSLMITSPSFPDGGEVPMKFAGARGGENKSPQFDFKWIQGMNDAEQPATVVTYAVIFHDIENSTNRGTADTLHWSAFNIPATAKGLPEGLAPGDLPDGTRNGPGIGARGGTPAAYFGPGAPSSQRLHHYVFEFYALDAKLDFPAGLPTREQLMAAMEGHVVGKAAYVGRFRTPAAP